MKSKQNLLFFILAVKHFKNLNVKKPDGKTLLVKCSLNCFDHKTLKFYDFYKHYFWLSYSVLFFPFGIAAVVTYLYLKQELQKGSPPTRHHDFEGSLSRSSLLLWGGALRDDTKNGCEGDCFEGCFEGKRQDPTKGTGYHP